MALFLTEGTSYVEEDTTTLEEAYDGLLEASLDMHELTEAMLQGDFILHERAQYLSEAEHALQENSFFAKAAAKVKEFIIKVRDKVVAFLKKIGEFAQKMWAKLTGQGKVAAPKGMAAAAATVTGALSALQAKVFAAKGKLYKKEAKQAEGVARQAMAKFKSLIGKEAATEEVEANTLATAFKYAAGAVAVGGTIYKLLSMRAKEVETIAPLADKAKATGTGVAVYDGGASSGMKNVTGSDKTVGGPAEDMAYAKDQTAFAQRLASLIGGFNTGLSKVRAKGAAAVDKVKDKIKG